MMLLSSMSSISLMLTSWFKQLLFRPALEASEIVSGHGARYRLLRKRLLGSFNFGRQLVADERQNVHLVRISVLLSFRSTTLPVSLDCATGITRLRYRYHSTTLPVSLDCATGITRLRYRYHSTALPVSLDCATGITRLRYRYHSTTLPVSLDCATGITRLRYRYRCRVLQMRD